MKDYIYVLVAFFLIGCQPNPDFKMIKADPVPKVYVTSPQWIEIHQDDVSFLGLDKHQFQILMSDLNSIADRMNRLDLVIEYYEKQIDEQD